MSATEFREYAAEHLSWAMTARSDRERELFQQMADAWLTVAALWERPLDGELAPALPGDQALARPKT